jgi:hypothetical protein
MQPENFRLADRAESESNFCRAFAPPRSARTGRGELAAAAKKFGKRTFEVWSHYNPLKSHETAKGTFGKAWRKTR